MNPNNLCYGHLDIKYRAECNTCPVDEAHTRPCFTESHVHIVEVLVIPKSESSLDAEADRLNEQAHQKHLLELIEQEQENPREFL